MVHFCLAQLPLKVPRTNLGSALRHNGRRNVPARASAGDNSSGKVTPSTDAPQQPPPGSSGINESVLARLRAAEQEAAALRAELEAAKATAGNKDASLDVAKEEQKSSSRIDGGDLRRETIFTAGSAPSNWLSENDVDFFTGGGPSERSTSASVTEDEQKIVQRRLLLGIGLTVAAAAFAIIPTEQLRPKPTKPLFFYLVPVCRVEELLKRAEQLVENGEWDELSGVLQRIQGNPNNIRANLLDAAAGLEAAAASRASRVALDALEYIEQIDYNKYYDSMSKPSSVQGSTMRQYAEFSLKSTKAAQVQLSEFLKLMPREQVEAAQQQAMTSPF